ncbi:DeoR/GlpR family DNA-binding transcription regulator [Glaesserella parasuis]|uniref:DeoR/GlpR family DNA-binding transcription regulator n=1 Tax=Glaesserella parasuis TaxID=738 RepID=UPI000165B59C|nr:DeoR/GlpR family DNA-binding transcription regulator [Glaesserella parasuis]AIK90581.1 DeoR faimly transcriptional regulator [Glaesserella parasuis]AWY44760.1 DeoR/GlpR transcriptional regulator [Glaesserella parasuis 29755]EQA07631.1 deoR-like helix-turn-helix domain protein [Glaesserella parasuis 84-15995]EQA95250.1 bacterial regulatory s, deoR family protein [Glaesserella parasuis 29755]KDD79142.1 DeoR faimly transcriptional regulator [Glaesserella parasuis ST4-1]
MIPAERQRQIIQIVNSFGSTSVNFLANRLNVSHMTIRRDIQKLEEEGKISSVSGGVQSLERLTTEPTHSDKSQLFHDQKWAIGVAAAKQIPHNATIYLDAGTTTLEIAHQIAERNDILVITNDFVIAHFLSNSGRCEIIHIGGSVCKENLSTTGMLAAQFLKNLSIDIAFISTSSWNLKGLTTPNENKIPVKLAIIEASRKNILVTDSSKYGKFATFFVYPLTVFDQIICDKGLLENAQESISSMNVNLLLV